MTPTLLLDPYPVPVPLTVTVDGTGFDGKSRLRLRLDGVVLSEFRAPADGVFRVGLPVTAAANTLVAEQYAKGSWSVVARLAPLLTFGKPAVIDTTPPVVTGVTANNITSTSVLISWTTNELANSQVDYGLTTGYLIGPTPLDTAFVTTHATPITGLTASTLYHYRVRTTDRKGNLTVGVDGTFTTLAGGVTDTTAPVISNIVAVPTANGVTISWDTDEPANAQFDYGTTLSFGQSSALDASFTQTHHTRTVAGLASNTTYYYRVRSIDPSGNVAQSSGTSTSYAPLVAADGATAYWRLGEPSGTNANDEIGTADGTYVNTPTLAQTSLILGESNTAVDFDQASDEYVTVPESSQIAQGNGAFSWEIWCKPGTLDATDRRLMMKGAVGNASPDLFVNGTSKHINFRSDGWGEGVASSQSVVSGSTYHIVGTVSASHFWRLYINGIEDSNAQGTAQTADDGNPLLICRKAGSSTNNFDGVVDDVAVYVGTELTPTQVANHFSGTLTAAASFTTPGSSGTYTASGPISVTNDNQIIEWKIIDSLPNQPMTLAGQTTGTSSSISLNRKNGVIIRNCILRGRQWGILAVDCDNLTIENCTITDMNYNGIGIFGGQNGRITGNTIQRVGMLRDNNGFPSYGDPANSYGMFFVSSDPSHGINGGLNLPPNTWLVQGNTVEDVQLWQGINSHEVSNLSIQSNIIRRCPRGIFVCGQLDHVNILNNQVLESVTKTGGTTDKSGISYGHILTGTISGNSISTSFSNQLNNLDAYCGASTNLTIGSNPSVP